MKNVYVLCPGGVVTGGTELLHQFVNELRFNHVTAYIVYFPFDKPFDKAEAFSKYNCPQQKLKDEKNSVIVIPESATKIATSIKFAKICIWWLSVDNYFYFPQNNKLKKPFSINNNKLYDWIRYLKSYFRHIPIKQLKKFEHYSQSFYAVDFLRKNNIKSIMLTDYLSSEHMAESNSTKKDVVLYNPKKGIEITRNLILRNPDIKFIPIENMSTLEVANVMRNSKVYIDFGNHPGKDRPPREAVIAGCCVITGLSGSAKYYEDVPISERYKLDIEDPEFLKKFRELLSDCLINYEKNNLEFDLWRNNIKLEESKFKKQVKQIIESYEN